MKSFNKEKAIEMFNKLNVSKPGKIKKPTKMENLMSIIDGILATDEKMYIKNKTALAKSAGITELTLGKYLKNLPENYKIKSVKFDDGTKALKIIRTKIDVAVSPLDEEDGQNAI